MALLLTEVAIQSDGTFGIAITNTSMSEEADPGSIGFIAWRTDGTGWGSSGLSTYGVPNALAPGATITVGHSSIAELDYSNSEFDVNFENCGQAVGIGNNTLFPDDGIGDVFGQNLFPNTVYVSPTTRAPDTSFIDPADLTEWTVTAGFTTATLCFGEGTLIATPEGERNVESLQTGDLVLTADGREVEVLWLGRQTLRPRIGVMPEQLQPVRIAAGALGYGLPHSDLIVTADHGMVLDGLVVNAGALVNLDTILWVPMAELATPFTVYHVETEAHEEILANGAPTETFIDYVGRQAFDNYDEYLALHGADRIIRESPKPRISASRLLPPALKARLFKGQQTKGRTGRLAG